MAYLMSKRPIGTGARRGKRLAHNIRATRTERDGYTFPSKLEARYYDQLLLRQRAGEVVMFLRQVPFHLPGGVTYRVDFQEFLSDGSVRFVDVKGQVLKEFVKIKKLVEAQYPVEIEVVKKV